MDLVLADWDAGQAVRAADGRPVSTMTTGTLASPPLMGGKQLKTMLFLECCGTSSQVPGGGRETADRAP
ncbi:hypothetical protein [Rhodoplanes azumiensis]|uniref:Uncharacterized protein n=1 Tax=Rhodoplanes azumiensis TaxID=1897628 RepID=A0ABW5AJK3_9BRAD